MSSNGTVRHAKKRAFIAAFSKCGIIKRSAKAAGIDRDTYRRWRMSDPEFAAKVEEAGEDAADFLEAVALRRAVKLNGSDTMLIFMLKAVRPSKFRDRVEHGGIGGGPIKIEMTQEDEAVARRIVESRFQLSEN